MLDPRRSLTLVFALAAIGCGGAESAAVPLDGSLRVTTVTTGASIDPDGYALELDAGPAQALGSTSTTLMAVPAGEHSVALSGIAPNCVVSGSNPRPVAVEAGATVEAVFDISCAPATGNLRLVVSTSGDALDTDGYILSVIGAWPKPAATADQVTFADLDAGPHVVKVTGLAVPACRVDGDNPRTVVVPADSTAEIPIPVLCSTQFGALNIHLEYGLFCADQDGVDVAVQGRAREHVKGTGEVLVSGLDPGQINIVITDIETRVVFAPPPTTPPPPRSIIVHPAVRAGETVRVPVQLIC